MRLRIILVGLFMTCLGVKVQANWVNLVLPYADSRINLFKTHLYKNGELILTTYNKQIEIPPGKYRIEIIGSSQQFIDSTIVLKGKRDVFIDLTNAANLLNQPRNFLNSLTNGDTVFISYTESSCWAGDVRHHTYIIYNSADSVYKGEARNFNQTEISTLKLTRLGLLSILSLNASMDKYEQNFLYRNFFIRTRKYYHLSEFEGCPFIFD